MPSIVTQQFDPLSAAASAVGDYQKNQATNALSAAAEARANAAEGRANTQLGLNQNADARAATTLTDAEKQQIITNQRADAAAALAAKTEADRELDKAREDAISLLKEQNAKTKNDQDYAAKMAKIQEEYAVEKAKLKNATTVAQIRAQGEIGAANIHAAAEVTSAGIHAGAEERGQDIAHGDRVAERNVVTRGQDLAHDDRVSTGQRQTAAHIATAITTLRRLPGSPPTPTDDPKLDEHIKDFATLSATARDQMLTSPQIPQSTKRYLQALAPQLTVLGQ